MDLAKTNLTKNILIGMLAGVVVGLLLFLFGLNENSFVKAFVLDGILKVVGDIFVRSLKVLVVPLVLVSLICGTAAMDDVRRLGSVGVKTVALYLATTCIAISIALGLAMIFQPGEGFELTDETVSYAAPEAPPLVDVIINIFPTNPMKAMADGNMLQVITFSILVGISLVLSGKPGSRVLSLFQDLNEVIMKLVVMLMHFAPFGVFAKITLVFATTGYGAIKTLGLYFVLVLSALVLHAIVVYPVLLKSLSGLNPILFFKKFRGTQMFAFSTASSNATIPVTLRSVEERLGVRNRVASFTVPLGATINMDGTAIMQGVATVFIANVAGVDLAFSQILMVIVTATLASIGTAGVPGVGLIMLAMVLQQVGLPVEYIGLIIGIDRLLDMVRTAVNVTGDATVSCIIAKSENEIDESVFSDPEAGILD